MDKLTAPEPAEQRGSEPAPATPVNTTSSNYQLPGPLITSPPDHLLDSNVFIESYNSQKQSIPSMADRFPSLEDFSEGQTEVADIQATTDDDFLARERAVLGEDAEQFATSQDHVAGENVGAGDDDLLGGGDEPVEEI
ncbi:unnamed protein product, partial [Penicillium crustosum]